MKTSEFKGGFVVDLSGIGLFFLVWFSVLILVDVTAVQSGTSVDLVNVFDTAVMQPIASVVHFTGDTGRFNQIGQRAYPHSPSRD